MMAQFWSQSSNFGRVFCVKIFMVNNLILNTLNDDSFQTNNLFMKTFAQLVFENNTFIINSELLK
jgi:hypothetical protein